MLTFNDFLQKPTLLEMPHIVLDGNNTVDLELEVHSRMDDKEFIHYIKNWLEGKLIKSKTPGLVMHVNKKSLHQFAEKVLNNQFFRLFVIKNYGSSVWSELENLLNEKV